MKNETQTTCKLSNLSLVYNFCYDPLSFLEFTDQCGSGLRSYDLDGPFACNFLLQGIIGILDYLFLNSPSELGIPDANAGELYPKTALIKCIILLSSYYTI